MDQAAFRALLNAPRPVSTDASAAKTSKAASAEAGSGKPAKQKAAAAAFKPRSTTKQADAAASYRDRASERRHQDADVEAELYSKLDYESSKFVGGDLAHTHLVKGLDFALLAKLRADEEGQEESSLDRALDLALPPTGEGASNAAPVPAASSAAVSRASVWARGVVAAALSARPLAMHSEKEPGAVTTRRGHLDIDVHADTAAAFWRAAAASSASRAAASPADGRWAPGRTTFVFRLTAFHPPLGLNSVSSAAPSLSGAGDGVALAAKALDVFDSDDAVPTMVIRSADDAPPAEPGLVYRLDPTVFTKISDSVHYLRTGKRVVRKQVQKEVPGTCSEELELVSAAPSPPPPAIASDGSSTGAGARGSSSQPLAAQIGATASSASADAKSTEEDEDDIFGGVGKYIPPAPVPAPVGAPGAIYAAIDAGAAAMDVAGPDIGPALPPSFAAMDDGVVGPYPADADVGPALPPLYPYHAHAHAQESAARIGPQPAPQTDSGEQSELDVVGPYPATDAQHAHEGVTGAYPGAWDGAQAEGIGGSSWSETEDGLGLAGRTEEDALAEWDAVEGAGDDTAAEKARKAREDDYRLYVEGPEDGARPSASSSTGAPQAQPAVRRVQGGIAGVGSVAGGEEEGDEAEDEELFGPTGSYLDTARAEIAALKGLGAGKAAVARGVSTSRAGSGGFSVLIADDDMAGVVTGSYTTDAFAEKHASGAAGARSAGSKEKAGGQAAAMASIARLKAGRTGKSDVDALRQGRFDALGEGGSDRGAQHGQRVGMGAVKSTWNARRFGEDEEEGGGGKGGQDGRKRARMETAKLDSDLVAINRIMEQRKAQGGSAGFEAVLAKGGSMPGEKKKRAGYKGDDD